MSSYRCVDKFWILAIACLLLFAMPGCKAKQCPAFQEGQRTGGSIDKNKKNKRNKSKSGVFDKKTMKRYRH